MDDLDRREPMRNPTPARPLLGLTVLVVEDSRFACEALRLLCLRSGARIRRADCLHAARRHLQVYRPTVIIVDLGLPDGSGIDLIAELDRAVPRIGVVLGTSGDPDGAVAALRAGADAFLEKPIADLAAFQRVILSRLPEERQPAGPRPVNEGRVQPDPMALRDDMAHAAEVLDGVSDGHSLDYVAQFLAGVARISDDRPLLEAAQALGRARPGLAARDDLDRLSGLVRDRLAENVPI